MTTRVGGASGRDRSRLERRPISQIVHAFLAEQIAARTLVRGQVLRENAVSALFGIGRMPASVALRRLEDDGLVHRRPAMHGVIVGTDRHTVPQVADLTAFEHLVAGGLTEDLKVRNWRTLIYPEVEREVASCLLFGRFRIRSKALAEHFGVSRTIANELLVRLERAGAVTQDASAHWYAGPLTSERIAELYQMRIILEPVALVQAAGRVSREELVEKLDRVLAARSADARSDVSLLHRLEVDLHHDVVLQCDNQELRTTLYRCQLPLITVHLSFGSYGPDSDIPVMLGSHERVLRHLVDGKVEAAADALTDHLTRSMTDSPMRLRKLRPFDHSALSPYLEPA